MISKEWEHDGLQCIVRMMERRKTVYPCGYVSIPENAWEKVALAADAENFEVHGGISFVGVLPEPGDIRTCIGFDMLHAGDGHYDEEYDLICDRTEEECVEETNRLAEQVRRFIDETEGE